MHVNRSLTCTHTRQHRTARRIHVITISIILSLPVKMSFRPWNKTTLDFCKVSSQGFDRRGSPCIICAAGDRKRNARYGWANAIKADFCFYRKMQVDQMSVIRWIVDNVQLSAEQSPRFEHFLLLVMRKKWTYDVTMLSRLFLANRWMQSTAAPD